MGQNAPTKDAPSKPETPAPAPTYQRINLDELPRRNAGPRVDMEAAKSLVAMAIAAAAESEGNEGVTDGIAYETAEKARTAGLRASRLAAHAMPKGKRASVVTGETKGGKGFAFALIVKDVTAPSA